MPALTPESGNAQPREQGYEQEYEEHSRTVKNWRQEFLRYRRGERDFPGPQPPLAQHLLEWRKQVAAAKHRAANGGGDNVVPISPDLADRLKRLALTPGGRHAEIIAIQREAGLDYESAAWLLIYRWTGGSLMMERESRFCEALEERLAITKAERALGKATGGAIERAPTTATPPLAQPVADAPLPYVDLALDLVPREWLVPERIPARNVTLLGGEGAIGKSLLLMQLSGAVVLGKEWIGTLPEIGPVLYMSCEEDDDEVRRRMEAVAQHLGSTRAEMIERGLRFLSFAGQDPILAQPDRAGVMRPTPVFERLRRDAIEMRPKLIVLDTVADIFAGKENDRAQTRQFITMLRGLAIEANSAVVVAAHPSLEGIRSDSGLSGSTGWHNSVRARMYFKAAPGDDPALRVLECRKNNYGPVSESIVLRWREGVYVIERKATLDRLAAEAEIDHLFLKLLRRLAEQGRTATDKKGTAYAPALFSAEPEAKAIKATSKMFGDAMIRLFAAKKIRVLTEGPQSKPRTRIVETDSSEEAASTNLPPAFHQRSLPLPPYPPARWNGAGLGGNARPFHRADRIGTASAPPRKNADRADRRSRRAGWTLRYDRQNTAAHPPI
jgi:RecA-family ATPase